MISDSSFLIDFLRGNSSAKKLYYKEKNNLIIPSIVIFELITGIELSKKSKESKRKITNFLLSFSTVNFNSKTGTIAGKINSDLIKTGKQIDVEDILIASSAIENKETIITNNTKHFSRINNVSIKTY